MLHGVLEGPCLWISAAVHGDEINGIEIIRRVVKRLEGRKLRGTLVAVPIVNLFGFLDQSRYLPDRRDLNRCFPGSTRGSLAARLAHLFMTEIVQRCSHGIDFHTGGGSRTNLPQIRADLDDPETLRCARAFGGRILIHSRTRDGSLREAASSRGKTALLFEGGGPLRFEPSVIQAGVRGTFRVMRELGMIHRKRTAPGTKSKIKTLSVRKTSWLRARRAGLLRLEVGLGDKVWKNQLIGAISDALGESEVEVRAPITGLVIGMEQNPVVHIGDAIVHLASSESDGATA